MLEQRQLEIEKLQTDIESLTQKLFDATMEHEKFSLSLQHVRDELKVARENCHTALLNYEGAISQSDNFKRENEKLRAEISAMAL
jgi:uncharacterized protein (DUF3084 family)